MQPDRPVDRLVSKALEAELATELRRHGLVVWLDKEGSWTAFVDELTARNQAGDFPHPVASLRGSWLELLLAVESGASAVERAPLLLHLPGQTRESIRETPGLELYEAGRTFQKKLQTLVQEVAAGRVSPDDLADYVKQPGITLADADAWLAGRLSSGREGLLGFLEGMEPEWLLDGLVAPSSPLRDRIQSEADREVLAARLLQLSGMDDAWRAFLGDEPTLEGLRDAFAKWLLCVEYAHDLLGQPKTAELLRLRSLPKPVVELCGRLTAHLRGRHADLYVRLADALEDRLAGESGNVQAGDLGRIDTFRFEEAKVLEAAVEDALHAARAGEPPAWDAPEGFVAARRDADSIWLSRDEPRRWAWRLLDAAVSFGRALASAPRGSAGGLLGSAGSPEEAVERYQRHGAAIDRAHRDFEERSVALWHHHLPHLALFSELRLALRAAHRAWADELAKDFTRLCKERGFLPDAGLQQRHLFDQVVRPLVDGQEKVALFLVDALRYEMAMELAEGMAAQGTVVDLKARLAELPTVTEVGMNVLAPVAGEKGRLAAVLGDRGFGGFRTGEFTVRAPEDRTRAMRARIGGQTCPLLPLDKVAEGGDSASLRQQIGHASLVVIHSREIDEAGEAGFGLATFSQTLRQLRAAFHHLQTAGVRRFVFTSDHGFLLKDAAAPARKFGDKRAPSRRYVIDPLARVEPGLVSVSLSELGYDGAKGHLLLPEDTTVFDTGATDTFVHGGNSLQERVIPVLTVTRRSAPGASSARFSLEAQPLSDVLGVRRLKLRVLSDELFPTGENRVRIAFRAVERPQVQARIRQVESPAVEERGALRLPTGKEWLEVLFDLEGPIDERVRLELYDPDGKEQVKSLQVEGWFEATGKAVAAAPAPADAGWREQIDDEGARRVLAHLEIHGSLTEAEALGMLGSARAARRFDLRLDEWARLLPFKVRTEGTSGGKRYVREG
ncbi:BREX-6 system phosphatase PglZ [Vulgatibacter incomptus]|uniref:Uncharacterized protein n=1 Tax=Vulgatibacter incomptus TaxID=1391653 RepID=A0A0K1PCS5_9BACT|nr:BREX-6 system phosphatase PglZ [Vulgatibacter incomptus]AKU90924.1 hypothetical protein AKJ08_1311 [Vulgatibacter incomptus]